MFPLGWLHASHVFLPHNRSAVWRPRRLWSFSRQVDADCEAQHRPCAGRERLALVARACLWLPHLHQVCSYLVTKLWQFTHSPVFRAMVQFRQIKRSWPHLSTQARERLFFFYWRIFQAFRRNSCWFVGFQSLLNNVCWYRQIKDLSVWAVESFRQTLPGPQIIRMLFASKKRPPLINIFCQNWSKPQIVYIYKRALQFHIFLIVQNYPHLYTYYLVKASVGFEISVKLIQTHCVPLTYLCCQFRYRIYIVYLALSGINIYSSQVLWKRKEKEKREKKKSIIQGPFFLMRKS